MFVNQEFDPRNTRTGKDGALYNSQGKLLSSVETFQAQVNVSNAKVQPLGTFHSSEIPQSYDLTLTFTEIVVEDQTFLDDLFNYMRTGQFPDWTFQGVIKGRNGNESRILYRECVPSGAIDLQNVSVGDIIKRSWSMFVNRPPEAQSYL